MNIQIWGKTKCFDTKKAERYFKERRLKYQMIDLKEKGMSRGELQSVVQTVKVLDNLLNPDAKDTQTLALVKYLVDADKLDKVFENQQIIKTPTQYPFTKVIFLTCLRQSNMPNDLLCATFGFLCCAVFLLYRSGRYRS